MSFSLGSKLRLATGGQSATGKEMFKRELEGKNQAGSKIRLAAKGSHWRGRGAGAGWLE